MYVPKCQQLSEIKSKMETQIYLSVLITLGNQRLDLLNK